MNVTCRATSAPLLLTVALLGCFAKPALVVQEFTLDPPAPCDPPSGGLVVELRRVEMAPAFRQRDLAYRTGPHKLELDPYASLAAPPAELCAAALRGFLRNAAGIGAVVAPGSTQAPELVIDAYVTELSGDFRSSTDPAGVVELDLTVSTPATAQAPARVVLRRDYLERKKIDTRTAAAVVEAWNHGLASAVESFAGDLKSVGSAAR